jgi:hypothetical protein
LANEDLRLLRVAQALAMTKKDKPTASEVELNQTIFVEKIQEDIGRILDVEDYHGD